MTNNYMLWMSDIKSATNVFVSNVTMVVCETYLGTGMIKDNLNHNRPQNTQFLCRTYEIYQT